METGAVRRPRDEAQRDLWNRTAAVAGRLNRAHADLVDIASELIEGRHWGDGGFRSPEHYFIVRAGLSPAHARDVVLLATRRAELPDTATALSGGELSLDQAAVVAHHAPASHQASVTHLARHATVPQLRRAVSRHPFRDEAVTGAAVDGAAVDGAAVDGAAVDGAAAPTSGSPDTVGGFTSEAERRACARPSLTMHYDRDGRFQLRYSAPATIGALVEQAVKEAKDALFTRQRTGQDAGGASTDGPGAGSQAPPDGHAGLPSYADALAEMAHRSLAGVASTHRGSHYRVYLHLATDASWINGGGAIPQRLLERFLTDGVLQPVWEVEGRPVSVGRAMRILPARSRRLIEDRDRGCRFPGCTATRFVEIHHLHGWASGGATDEGNQVSLCPFHHDAIDRGDYTITGDPTRLDGLVVVNRHGHRLRPPSAQELAPAGHADRTVPTRGSPPTQAAGDDEAIGGRPAYQPPTGERIRWSDVELPADRELALSRRR